MPDMLKDGLAFLTETLAEYASQAVTYRRGAYSAEVRATYGQKMLKLQSNDGGLYIQRTDMDFLIPTEDLILNGSAVLPERGDFIEITSGATTERYEAASYGDDDHWHWADPHQSMVRIHTRRVSIP